MRKKGAGAIELLKTGYFKRKENKIESKWIAFQI